MTSWSAGSSGLVRADFFERDPLDDLAALKCGPTAVLAAVLAAVSAFGPPADLAALRLRPTTPVSLPRRSRATALYFELGSRGTDEGFPVAPRPRKGGGG